MRNLNPNEVSNVNGGWIPLVIIAAAALLSGCSSDSESQGDLDKKAASNCDDGAYVEAYPERCEGGG